MMAAHVRKQIHGHVLKLGYHNVVFVHVGIIHIYDQTGELSYGRMVFDKSNLLYGFDYGLCIPGFFI